MMKQIHMLILSACLLNLSAVGSSLADEVEVEEIRRCIHTRNLRNSAVIDDLNVLFFTRGKTVYHNILPRQCRGLSLYGRFTYRTTAGSLCSLDTIEIPGGVGKTCLIGEFHVITKNDIPGLIETLRKPPEPLSLPSAEVEEIAVEYDEPQ